MAVPSPCIDVCTVDDATGLCRGCARTLDEIARWSVLSDVEKLQVWRLLRQRQAQQTPPGADQAKQRGGRA